MSTVSKYFLFIMLFAIVVIAISGAYFAYLDYVDHKRVHGEWIEIGAPSYSTDVLIISAKGVYKNSRLITNQFKFDGSHVYIGTGAGHTVYKLTESFGLPQLHQIVPATPNKKFIKKGYEKELQDNAKPARFEMLRKVIQEK